MFDLLLEFYAAEGPERVGFILDDGAVVEVENVSGTPDTGFDICAEDLITFGERAVASFHTHPGASANLSVEDASTFLTWPNLKHYIIGNDGIRTFEVKGNQVVQA